MPVGLTSPCKTEKNCASILEFDPDQGLTTSAGTKRKMVHHLPLNSCSQLPPPGSTSVLIAKIRKQAKELSELHEDLATKEKLIEKLRNSSVKGQAVANGEREKVKLRGAEAHEWKMKFLKEKTKHEASVQRIQELKCQLEGKEKEKARILHHNQEFESLVAKYKPELCNTFQLQPNFSTDGMKMSEETLYLRILEEAVQLKAEEFNVGGEAELITVLAELRQKNQEQQERIKDLELQLTDYRVKQELPLEHDIPCLDGIQNLSSFSAEKQLENLAREPEKVTREHEQIAAESKQLKQQYNDLLLDYGSLEAEKETWEAKTLELQRSLSDLKEEFNRKDQHLSELKHIQDELFVAIGDASAKEALWKEKNEASTMMLDTTRATSDALQAKLNESQRHQKRLENELQAALEQASTHAHAFERVTCEKEKLAAQVAELEAYEASFDNMKQHRKNFTVITQAESQMRADLHLIDAFVSHVVPLNSQSRQFSEIESLTLDNMDLPSLTSFVEWALVGDVLARVSLLEKQRLPPQIHTRLPKLSAFLHDVSWTVSNLVKHVASMERSWKKERGYLISARDAFEASANLIQSELDMFKTWSFQLQEESQQHHRASLDLEQQLSQTKSRANIAEEDQNQLHQRVLSLEKKLHEEQLALKEAHAVMEVQDSDWKSQCAQVQQLSVEKETNQNELAHMTHLYEEAHSVAQAMSRQYQELCLQRESSQSDVTRLEQQVLELQLVLSEQRKLAESGNRVKLELEEHQRNFAKTMEERCRQIEGLRHHIQTLEYAAWNVYNQTYPKIGNGAHKDKPHDGDANVALLQLPMLIDTLVAQEVKKATQVSMKEALLRNCHSVDYVDPSLSLIREMKADHQSLMDENQTLKAQVSDLRNDQWPMHMTFEGLKDATHVNENFLSPVFKGAHVRKADIVQNLRKKLKAKQRVSVENNEITETCTKSMRRRQVDDQLAQLQAAFASFRTKL